MGNECCGRAQQTSNSANKNTDFPKIIEYYSRMFSTQLLAVVRRVNSMLTKNNVELLSASSTDESWVKRMSKMVRTGSRVTTAIAMVISIISLISIEQTGVVDFIVVALLIPLFALSYFNVSFKMVAMAMIGYLYTVGTLLLIMQGATGHPSLFFFSCAIYATMTLGMRVSLGLYVLCLSTLILFGCGVESFAPSLTCLVKPTQIVLTRHVLVLAVFMASGIAVITVLDLRAKYGLRKEQQLAADLARKSDELAFSLEKEQEINQMRSNLINVVSHEFRTPLTVISLSSKMLKRKYSKDKLTPADLEKYHGQIEENLGRLADLIDIVVANKPETDNELNQLIEQVKGDSWAV